MTNQASTPKTSIGIECPNCGCKHFYVIYTRRAASGKLVRRRECRNCGRRMTTWESVIGLHLLSKP